MEAACVEAALARAASEASAAAEACSSSLEARRTAVRLLRKEGAELIVSS
jgi:hypothetical protein